MKKAVCLLSGGPDSAIAAAAAKKSGYELYCLTFDYGQIGVREIESAKKIAKHLNAKEHRIVDISCLKRLYSGVTPLLDKNMPIPKKFEPSLIVPFRNGIMLAIAAGYATTKGTGAIFYGAHKTDAPFYPDCRKEFVAAMEKAVKLGTGVDLKIMNPLAELSKTEVIKLAKKLNVRLELTWSCYLNKAKHCGRCESCMNRKRAFVDAGIPDPTSYEI